MLIVSPFTPSVSYGDIKVILTFESVDEILGCDHSNETSSAVLSHGTIYKLSIFQNEIWDLSWILFLGTLGSERVNEHVDCFSYRTTQNDKLFFGLRNHSYSRDWLWKLASFKGRNKGAAIYVENTTTVHNLLFNARTLWLNNLKVTFLLVRCSCKIQKLLLFVHGQG